MCNRPKQQNQILVTMNRPPLFHSSHRMRGLTLIELMVTLSVLVILMALAAPNFQATIASSRLTSTTNDLMATLAQARSNAIRRGARVTVCKSANGTQCIATGNWEQGWIMFNDDDHSVASASVDSGETITFAAPALTNSLVINGNLAYVSYAANGQPKTMLGAFLPGKIRICSTASSLSNDKRARDLVLSATGRITLGQPTGIAATCPAP